MESVICDCSGDPRGWRMVLVPASKLGVDRNLITLTVSGKDIQLVRKEKIRDADSAATLSPQGL